MAATRAREFLQRIFAWNDIAVDLVRAGVFSIMAGLVTFLWGNQYYRQVEFWLVCFVGAFVFLGLANARRKERTILSGLPAFTGRLTGYYVDPRPDGRTGIALFAEVTNRGADSAIDEITSVEVMLPGTTTWRKPQEVAIPDAAGVVIRTGADPNQGILLKPEDMFIVKMTETIERGGKMSGAFLLVFDLVEAKAFDPAGLKARVTFVDVFGQDGTIEGVFETKHEHLRTSGVGVHLRKSSAPVMSPARRTPSEKGDNDER